MMHNIHTLLTKKESCPDVKKIESCTYDSLGKCENKIPVNFAKDAFKSLFDQLPCNSAEGRNESETEKVIASGTEKRLVSEVWDILK